MARGGLERQRKAKKKRVKPQPNVASTSGLAIGRMAGRCLHFSVSPLPFCGPILSVVCCVRDDSLKVRKSSESGLIVM